MWPLVILTAAVVFLSDVFFRRVMISFTWVPALVARLPFLRRQAGEEASPPIERLKRSKASVARRIEAEQSAARFDPAIAPDATKSVKLADEKAVLNAPADASSPGQTQNEDAAAAPEFTARLLEAKRRVHDGRKSSE